MNEHTTKALPRAVAERASTSDELKGSTCTITPQKIFSQAFYKALPPLGRR